MPVPPLFAMRLPENVLPLGSLYVPSVVIARTALDLAFFASRAAPPLHVRGRSCMPPPPLPTAPPMVLPVNTLACTAASRMPPYMLPEMMLAYIVRLAVPSTQHP